MAARRLTEREADDSAAAVGLRRLEPYGGNAATPQPYECLTCGDTADSSLSRIRRGRGCTPCAEEANARRTGRPVRKRARRQPSAERQEEAVATMTGHGWLPLELFRGGYVPWLSKCLGCRRVSRPTLDHTRRGYVCRFCAPDGYKYRDPSSASLWVHRQTGRAWFGKLLDGSHREGKLRGAGWEPVREIHTETGYAAWCIVQEAVKRLRALGVQPALSRGQMPYGGWQRTWDTKFLPVEKGAVLLAQAAQAVDSDRQGIRLLLRRLEVEAIVP